MTKPKPRQDRRGRPVELDGAPTADRLREALAGRPPRGEALATLRAHALATLARLGDDVSADPDAPEPPEPLRAGAFCLPSDWDEDEALNGLIRLTAVVGGQYQGIRYRAGTWRLTGGPVSDLTEVDDVPPHVIAEAEKVTS